MKHNKIKTLGQVFTPPALVNEMLDKLPKELFIDSSKTFLDPSCGNGNFLIEVLNRKMANGISHKDALLTIYGVDIDYNVATECRTRLKLGSTDDEIRRIVDNNIICADALDKNHLGWSIVGYMWGNNKFFN